MTAFPFIPGLPPLEELTSTPRRAFETSPTIPPPPAFAPPPNASPIFFRFFAFCPSFPPAGLGVGAAAAGAAAGAAVGAGGAFSNFTSTGTSSGAINVIDCCGAGSHITSASQSSPKPREIT